MAVFLEKYVRQPLADLLEAAPTQLPDLTLSIAADKVVFSVGGKDYELKRDSHAMPLHEETDEPEADEQPT